MVRKAAEQGYASAEADLGVMKLERPRRAAGRYCLDMPYWRLHKGSRMR